MKLYLPAVLAYFVTQITAHWENIEHASQHSKSDLGLEGRSSVVERDGVKHIIFDHKATGSKLDFVTNSGICETTPGVNQYSGYFSVGTNISYFFWFFEARHSPEYAPLAAWFSGGPGCSSMLGLFQENGPCQFYGDSSIPSLNPYSWNEYANMLYIDQPAGTGFSYDGVTNATVEVNSTAAAAPFVWKFVQAFFNQFPQYENRGFGIFTESYGGHYGPEFAHYFEQQNKAIGKGTINGEKVDLVALGINNGWYDAVIQERQEIEFYYKNSYYPLINESTYQSLIQGYNEHCLPALKRCTSAYGSDLDIACMEADVQCALAVDDPAGNAIDPSIDSYDIRQSGPDWSKFTPLGTYQTWLTNPAIMKAIGARGNYTECSAINIPDQFDSTGDPARSLLPELSEVVKCGVNVIMWAGDADMVCDWMGNEACANAVDYDDTHVFQQNEVKNYTVDGVVVGAYKAKGNLNWLRVFDSGHYVAYFQPKLALQVFEQVMKGEQIHST
ncbi:carboxypeptidase-like protein S1 [Stipitochalara longipes BDJ]|nr:carboxypeptidase-like protein S1 [Stipitochalara longipes BDJ]